MSLPQLLHLKTHTWARRRKRKNLSDLLILLSNMGVIDHMKLIMCEMDMIAAAVFFSMVNCLALSLPAGTAGTAKLVQPS